MESVPKRRSWIFHRCPLYYKRVSPGSQSECTPIILELELETRAGSPLMIDPLDPLNPLGSEPKK